MSSVSSCRRNTVRNRCPGGAAANRQERARCISSKRSCSAGCGQGSADTRGRGHPATLLADVEPTVHRLVLAVATLRTMVVTALARFLSTSSHHGVLACRTTTFLVLPCDCGALKAGRLRVMGVVRLHEALYGRPSRAARLWPMSGIAYRARRDSLLASLRLPFATSLLEVFALAVLLFSLLEVAPHEIMAQLSGSRRARVLYTVHGTCRTPCV